MLEAALIPYKVGMLPRSLTENVFHYERVSATSSSQICKATHPCSARVPVWVSGIAKQHMAREGGLYNSSWTPRRRKKPIEMPL